MFDLEAVLKNYAEPNDTLRRSTQRLIDASEFLNDPETLAVIGLGGTISSGYSYNKETIVPGPYSPAAVLLKSIKQMFGTSWTYTTIDLFAKDSRDITDADLCDLLNFLACIDNKRVLITCGTYMLPKICELLERAPVASNKTIGVTGSMLPQGFVHSDAPANILGTLAAMDVAVSLSQPDTKTVLSAFHGKTYMNLDAFRSMDLHPETMKDTVLIAPQASMPVKTGAKNTS